MGENAQMIPALSLLHEYASIFRKIVNSQVLGSNDTVQHLLKLTDEKEWHFLTAAMDIIDDASEAIGHVQRFGLSGPTKYNEFGEKYLRLYGLLSATYIQQESILTIYKTMSNADCKKMKERVYQLQMRQLRNKLSAHGTDYREGNTTKAYVPLRLTLTDDNVTAVRYTPPFNEEHVNLADAIDHHTQLMIDALDMISDNLINTLFEQDKGKQQEFLQELSDLRIQKAGGLVYKGPEGVPRIVITFSDP
jgi:hypothetical protein